MQGSGLRFTAPVLSFLFAMPLYAQTATTPPPSTHEPATESATPPGPTDSPSTGSPPASAPGAGSAPQAPHVAAPGSPSQPASPQGSALSAAAPATPSPPVSPTPATASAGPVASPPAGAVASPTTPHETAAPLNREAPLESETVPAKGLWSPTIYGFVEFLAMHDSTQNFAEIPGNGAIARPGTMAGDNGRTTFSGRGSRIGLKWAAPEIAGIRPTALGEVDFFANQPAISPATGSAEGSFFTNSGLRIRHFALKLETPYVDITVGQTWQLFGNQPFFVHAAVETPGAPGQISSRSPQVRLSRMFKTAPINVEIAAAAIRPPQRDAELPEGQGALRILVNGWKGVHTSGATGTSVDALSVGVSGTVRQFRVPEFVVPPTGFHKKTGWGLSVNALVPVIPATKNDRANALTLLGSFVNGTGISDQFTGLTGGVGFSAAPGSTAAAPWPQDVDSGMVTYDAQGVLHTIDWQSYIIGVQYYLPPSGSLWISANYSHLESRNANLYGLPASRVYTQAEWFNANLFWDVVKPVRVGIEWSLFKQTYADNVRAENTRMQFGAWYLF